MFEFSFIAKCNSLHKMEYAISTWKKFKFSSILMYNSHSNNFKSTFLNCFPVAQRENRIIKLLHWRNQSFSSYSNTFLSLLILLLLGKYLRTLPYHPSYLITYLAEIILKSWLNFFLFQESLFVNSVLPFSTFNNFININAESSHGILW